MNWFEHLKLHWKLYKTKTNLEYARIWIEYLMGEEDEYGAEEYLNMTEEERLDFIKKLKRGEIKPKHHIPVEWIDYV